MAQGYIYPSNEDMGDQYFSELLARNLFQGPEKMGDFKMHDLLHDLARKVAGYEIKLLDGVDHIHNEFVHVNLHGSKWPASLKVARRLRSMLGITYYAEDEKLLSKNQSLRVLSMGGTEFNEPPNFLGRLIHLRYLDLGKCYNIKCLPDWLARLENLQTLKLDYCRKLRELPRDFVKLTNLRHLLLPDYMIDLPPNFGKMTSLQELNRFIVGKCNGLDSLGSCWNYRGKLDIRFCKWRRDAIEEVKRANLKDNHQLTSLVLNFVVEEEEMVTPSVGEMNEMLKCLQLPSNLECLEVEFYQGDELPGGLLDGLSQLFFLGIYDCEKCKVLLRVLILWADKD